MSYIEIKRDYIEIAINCKNLFPDNSSAIILNNITELDEKFNNTTS